MNAKPRLLIVSFSDISSDARVLKQVRLFADRYDVTTCGYGDAPDPRVRHLQLAPEIEFRTWTRTELVARRYRHIYWNQPAVKAVLDLAGSAGRFDVVLADDIDTVGVALALEPTRGVHADIHEYAPRQYDEILVWRVFVAPYVRWMCRQFLPRAGSMTTVGGGLADEYRRVFGLEAAVVTNATPYAELEPSPVTADIRIVHSGAALRNRRLEVIVEAVETSTAPVSLDLYLMGNDPGYVEELRSMTAQSARVRVLDPVPYNELIGILNGYDIGIHVIPPTNFNNRWSLPNKFFDYVQARLGLIIGPSPEMASRLSAHGNGAVADGFDADSVRRVLDSLTVDQVRAWKQASHAAAREMSSEVEVLTWQAAIDRLAGHQR